MKKAQLGFNVILSLVCLSIRYFLAAQMIYTIINSVVGGFGDVEGLFVKLLLWFGLIILLFLLFNTIRIGGFFKNG